MKEEWWESDYLIWGLLALWGIAWWIWGWQGFVFGLLSHILGRVVIEKAELKRQLDFAFRDIGWLKERLFIVDATGADGWITGGKTLRPPPDEIVGRCPRCSYAIRRDQLDGRYNGGYEQRYFDSL